MAKRKAKGTKVSTKEKRKMWEMYQEKRSYKAVAKSMRRNPATVARYVSEFESMLTITHTLTE